MNIDKVYILVYNGKKNDKPAREIRNRLEILEDVKFNLDKYKGTFFRNALTIPEDVFMSDILDKL